MSKKINISEQALLEIITSVLTENRKVLKVGGQSSVPSAPVPDMGAMSPQGDMGAMPPQGDMGAVPPQDGMDPGMGAMPPADGGAPQDNQFDTNFDAGVEADEETDPKHYIQQLTGKLSQSINSFNEENGPDAGLCKYVASMIIAATCKNLDEKAKKELIEKINTAESNDETEPEGEEGDNVDMGDDDTTQDQPQQPLQERILTKKELCELALGMTRQERKKEAPKVDSKQKSIFSGKSFK